jgi:hypothetical protein
MKLPRKYLAMGELESALDDDLEVVDAETRRLLKVLHAVLTDFFHHEKWPADPGGQRLMLRLVKLIPLPHDLLHIIQDEASLRATGESIFHPEGILSDRLDPVKEAVWQARKSTKH